MDELELQQRELEEHTTSSAEVWERLDHVTRARVIELFAHSAYNYVTARHRAAMEECDVSSGREAEGNDAAH